MRSTVAVGKFADLVSVGKETMDTAEILVLLLASVAALALLAQRLTTPYPILLVLGGLTIGFIPGLPSVRLSPELVLLIFLPPLLT